MADSNQSQNRPASKDVAPDPSFNYERSHPEREAGMGRLDNNDATPMDQPDREDAAVKNKQEPRQLNADETADNRDDHAAPDHRSPARSVSAERVQGRMGDPDHSMKDEEPLGWDQAPTGPAPDREKRQPRTGGKGGTPDAGESRRNG